jgi:hypothetical protein
MDARAAASLLVCTAVSWRAASIAKRMGRRSTPDASGVAAARHAGALGRRKSTACRLAREPWTMYARSSGCCCACDGPSSSIRATVVVVAVVVVVVMYACGWYGMCRPKQKQKSHHGKLI